MSTHNMQPLNPSSEKTQKGSVIKDNKSSICTDEKLVDAKKEEIKKTDVPPPPGAVPGSSDTWASAAEREQFIQRYVQEFWDAALVHLYEDRYLVKAEQIKALRLIRKFYEPYSKKQMESFHKIYLERISLAGDYVKRDADKRFIPLPSKYFDMNFKYGFVGTKKWYMDYKKHKEAAQRQIALSEEVCRFKNNESKPYDKKKDREQLLLECIRRLKSWEDEGMIAEFHARIQGHGSGRKIR